MNGWEPRIENSIEIINASQVAALHSLLDSGAHEIGVGDVLPPLWHWVARVGRTRFTSIPPEILFTPTIS